MDPIEDRTNFVLRIIRFLTYFFLLFLIVTALINPQDKYYATECAKR
jgi:hypothetical protein